MPNRCPLLANVWVNGWLPQKIPSILKNTYVAVAPLDLLPFAFASNLSTCWTLYGRDRRGFQPLHVSYFLKPSSEGFVVGVRSLAQVQQDPVKIGSLATCCQVSFAPRLARELRRKIGIPDFVRPL